MSIQENRRAVHRLAAELFATRHDHLLVRKDQPATPIRRRKERIIAQVLPDMTTSTKALKLSSQIKAERPLR